MQTTSKSAKTTFIVLGVLMLLIGAHIGGIFFLRLALAFVTCAVINILYLRFRGDAREPETAPNEVS